MIYKFKFTQKPFASPIEGQVETDNFYKWFVENAPYGVRLSGQPKPIEQREGGGNGFYQRI
jgi:hypothetical protein